MTTSPLPAGRPVALPAPSAETVSCDNCSAPLAGPYCHECGQRDEDHLASLRTFVAHLLEVVLQYDSRALRTARAIISRPGALTAEYLAGRRVRYMPPLQTYLVCTALLFLAANVRPLARFVPSTRMYATTLAGTVGFNTTLNDAEVTALAARGVSLDLFGERFVEFANARLSATLLLVVPAVALLLALLYLRSGRPFTYHLVFAMHWVAFYMVVMAVMQLLPRSVQHAYGVTEGMLLLTVAYLAIALRRVYASAWPGAVVRAVIAIVAFQVILVAWLELVVVSVRRSI